MTLRVLLISLLLALTFAMPAQVEAQSASEPKTHTVEARETLFSISRKFSITVQNIRDWNKLESDVVAPGTILIVSEPPQSNQGTNRERTQVPPQPKPQEEVPTMSKPETTSDISDIIHVVDSGETLYSLSRLYNISVSDIRDWNDMTSDALSLNQKLIVGFDTTYTSVMVIDTTEISNRAELEDEPVVPAETVPEEDKLRVEDENTTAEYYTVRRGDTLSSISRRYGVTLSDLREWNEITGDVISVGQELVVGRTVGTKAVTGLSVESTAQGRFYEYEMKQNDSIYRVLLNHQMDEVDFEALNSGLSPSDVRPGMTVVLLAPPTVNHSNPYLIRPSQSSLTADGLSENGLTEVSIYEENESGQSTTGGDLYNPTHLTAAHQSLRLGSVVHVVNPENKKGVFVLINDRITNNSIKLSSRAYQALGLDKMREPKVVVNTSVN